MNPPTQPSATPRTQAQLLPINSHTLPHDVVYADFARTLETELAALQSVHDTRLHAFEEYKKVRDAELARLRSENERLKGKNWLERAEERQGFIARAERAEAALADPHALHAHCVRTLTDAQVMHLFGERATVITNQRDALAKELENIANAKPHEWGDESDQFQPWAQNRARHALAAMQPPTP